MRILLVEDDSSLGPTLKKDLENAGYAVDLVTDGREGEILGNIEPYDAVVLDLGLPTQSGLETLNKWRSSKNTVPVIVLTARDAWHERVEGFKAGADDYLGKPFHTEELLLRISAVLKRVKQQPGGKLTQGYLSLDEETQTVLALNDEVIELTGTEFRLLRYFMMHPGKILSKSRLTEHVYDYDSDKDSNVLEVYVKRLRKKLGHDIIQTKRGQGYVFIGGE